MLYLDRAVDEAIIIGDDIKLQVVSIERSGQKCRIGIEAPQDVPVDRMEIRRIKDRRARGLGRKEHY